MAKIEYQCETQLWNVQIALTGERFEKLLEDGRLEENELSKLRELGRICIADGSQSAQEKQEVPKFMPPKAKVLPRAGKRPRGKPSVQTTAVEDRKKHKYDEQWEKNVRLPIGSSRLPDCFVVNAKK